MKKTVQLYVLPLVFLCLFALPILVDAQSSPIGGDPGQSTSRIGGDPGTPTSPTKLINPIFTADLTQLVARILAVLVNILLPIAVLFLVWAGFKFVTAGGNSEKVKEARQMFLWTVTGIALILGARLLGEILSSTVKSITG